MTNENYMYATLTLMGLILGVLIAISSNYASYETSQSLHGDIASDNGAGR